MPKDKSEATRYVETALAWRDAGAAMPFATVRVADGAVIGSTRFFNLERWAWPPGIERLGATFQGILRAHRIAVDAAARDSARYSILASEWAVVKARLTGLLDRG